MIQVFGTGKINTDIVMTRREVGDEKYVFVNFQIGSKRLFRKGAKPTYDYIWAIAYQKQAEFLEKYAGKGTRISFSGMIKTEYYTAKNGTKAYSLKLDVTHIEILDKAEGKDIEPGDYVSSNMDISGLETAEYISENPNA